MFGKEGGWGVFPFDCLLDARSKVLWEDWGCYIQIWKLPDYNADIMIEKNIKLEYDAYFKIAF